ncbi:MAG: nucleoside monophosphate kinase [Patescibacteria group bacterium]
MNIVVIGPPGSGKTTQAQLLAQNLGAPHLNTGDLLYYASKGSDPEAQEIKLDMEKGQMVDEDITESLIKQYLNDHKDAKNIVIDGFPRTLSQAEKEIFPVDRVYYIKVSDEESRKRLTSRGRADDSEETIKERLKVYHKETEPILEFYRPKGVLEEIDGEHQIEEIAQDLEKRSSLS